MRPLRALWVFLVALVALGTPWVVSAQGPARRVTIVDETGMHAVSVVGGSLATSGGAGGASAISHISAAVHVAGISNTVMVNCVTGCAGSSHLAVTQGAQPWTIQHIASAVHVIVAGRPGVAAHQAGTWTVDVASGSVTVTGTVGATQSGAWNVASNQSGVWSIASAHIVGGSGHLAVTFAGGGHIAVTQAAAWNISCSNCSGGASDAVNVFHQSTIRHISSVTHVYVVDLPRSAHLAAAQSGTWTVQAAHQGGAWVMNVQHIASMLHVAIVDLPRWAHMAVAQSGVWNVTAHQGGTGYTIQHISSAVHIAGIIQVNCVTGCAAGPTHTAVTQADQWRIAHINSVTHVIGNMTLRSQAGTAVTVTGTALDVNCTGCSAAAAVNVGHISGALHIAGTVRGAMFHIQGVGTPGQAHGGVLTVQGIGVDATVTVATNAPPFRVAHITSLTHVGGSLQIQDMTCTTCRARVDHYNALVVQPHISGAFRAWRVSKCGSTATQMIATNHNRRDLYIQNLGGPTVTPSNNHYNVYLGFGTTGHVALTANNGWTLHAMTYLVNPTTTTLGPGNFGPTTQLILPNYQGPVSCISVQGATVGILEILR